MKPMRLGDILVENDLITESQLMSALQIQRDSQGKKLGEILIDLEIISELQMLKALQQRLNTEFVNLVSHSVSREALALVSEEIAREKHVVPYKLEDNVLYVATANPLDFETLNQIGTQAARSVESVIATSSDITSAIEKFYNNQTVNRIADVLDATAGVRASATQITREELQQLESRVENVPVVRFINNLIKQAFEKRASDIHIEPFEETVRIRFRIDGELTEIVQITAAAHANVVTRVKIMAEMDIAEKRIPLDGRFITTINNLEVGVRAATMPTIFGEKVVLRLSSSSSEGILSLEALGIVGDNARQLRNAITNPYGLILVAGPTGSGKTTTMYSLLCEISTESSNVLTVEDPVEKIIPGVNQTQVNVRAGLTFASGLRAILRQDPDKIMIGEIRDNDTADIAARSAMTGHLVIASIHTNSAASTFARFTDMGIEPFVVASSVVAILAQRLIRQVCVNCKTEYEPDLRERMIFERAGRTAPERLAKGTGCEYCNNTGSLGRTAVVEMVVTDNKIREMIMENVRASEIEDYLRISKNQRFISDQALDLVEEGRISIQELRYISQVVED